MAGGLVGLPLDDMAVRVSWQTVLLCLLPRSTQQASAHAAHVWCIEMPCCGDMKRRYLQLAVACVLVAMLSVKIAPPMFSTWNG